MFTIENIIDYSGVAGCAINIVQSERIHSHEVADAKRRHQESTALAVAQHEKDMKIAKQTYLMAAFTSLEQHFQVTVQKGYLMSSMIEINYSLTWLHIQQLNADLISSSKESESDMFDQRNQCFQTVILSATIMFSSLVTVIFQG